MGESREAGDHGNTGEDTADQVASEDPSPAATFSSLPNLHSSCPLTHAALAF